MNSFLLEDDFWLALRALAAEQDLALNALVSRIDADRGIEIGLASAIRVYVLRELQGRIPRAG